MPDESLEVLVEKRKVPDETAKVPDESWKAPVETWKVQEEKYESTVWREISLILFPYIHRSEGMLIFIKIKCVEEKSR